MEHIRRIFSCSSPLSIAAIGMFSISSILLARFIYIFPLSPTFDWASASLSFFSLVSVAALAFFIYVTIVWSFSQALTLFVISILISTLAEILGLSSGVIFGSFYCYHPDIGPRIASCLPMVIPLGWFVFCCIPLILLRPWLVTTQQDPVTRKKNAPRVPQDIGMGPSSGTVHRRSPHQSEFPNTTSLMKRILFCSLLLTSFNLYLEPLFVYTRSWTWAQPGPYFGAPLANLAGWFLVGIGIYSCFFFIQNRCFRHATTKSSRLDYLLIGLFLVWVLVALVMTNEKLNSLTPLWLTVIVLVPALGFRVSRETRKKVMATPLPAIHNTNVPD